jgi:hypothetical protein
VNFDLICSIYLYKLLRAQDGQKPSVMIKSHEIVVIYM